MKHLLILLISMVLISGCKKDQNSDQPDPADLELTENLDGSLHPEIVLNGSGTFFTGPADQTSIPKNAEIEFGAISTMKVKPAGKAKKGEGYFVLMLNSGPIEEGKIVPENKNHIHFKKGEKMARPGLSPGTQKLSLQFVDGEGKSYGRMFYSEVTVTVEDKLEDEVFVEDEDDK